MWPETLTLTFIVWDVLAEQVEIKSCTLAALLLNY